MTKITVSHGRGFDHSDRVAHAEIPDDLLTGDRMDQLMVAFGYCWGVDGGRWDWSPAFRLYLVKDEMGVVKCTLNSITSDNLCYCVTVEGLDDVRGPW